MQSTSACWCGVAVKRTGFLAGPECSLRVKESDQYLGVSVGVVLASVRLPRVERSACVHLDRPDWVACVGVVVLLVGGGRPETVPVTPPTSLGSCPLR